MRGSLFIGLLLAAPLSAQDAYFNANGVSIHYVVQGTGEPVVLVHGIQESLDLWMSNGIFPALARDHQVIAFDLRGHGRSGKPHDPGAYGRQMTFDIVRLLDRLRIRRAHIVGYSLGAHLTSQLLTIYPERFISATLIAAAGRLNWDSASARNAGVEANERAHDCISRSLMRRLAPPDVPPPSEDRLVALAAACDSTQDRLALAAMTRAWGEQAIDPNAAAGVTVPTLGIVGSRDPFRPQLEMLKKLRPGMSLIVVPNATHAGPDGILGRPELLAALRNFLASSTAQTLFIRHVAVVDVVSGQLHRDLSVEIRGRTISAMDSGDRLRMPRGATLIEGQGRYLIPGLWDMHVHLSFPDGAAQIFLPMMVANGVLGARDMHSFLETIVALKRSVASGAQIGPRLFIAGSAVDGPNSYLPAARIVHTPDEARQAVRELKGAGVDFIKVYSSLPKDLYVAVAAEAKSEGIPFVGHVPYVVTAAEASDAGQRSLEHLTEVDVGTSRDEAGIKAEEAEAMSQRHGYLPDPDRLKSTFDSAKAAALFDRFRQNDTWQVPTLVVLYQEREIADSTLQRKDSLIAYIPKLLRNYWRSLPVDIATKEFGLYEVHARLIARLERAGVPMLAGSDTPNPFVYPGFSLHDELGLLVRSGLTPGAALRTATINPARFLGVTDSLGTVAIGKVADLVLLDGNPLTDIANTKRIRAVIQGGRLMNRAALDSMLALAKTRAAADPAPVGAQQPLYNHSVVLRSTAHAGFLVGHDHSHPRR